MLLLANFVAADPEVQELFNYGRRMQEIEGDGRGGGETSRLRQALYERVAASWQRMQEAYKLRQLHFHLPPATSFLRVHAPQKFGDDLSGIRQIIVDANAQQQALSGFETGRIYSGIRGIVPVWYTRQDGSQKHIGSLEAGTSVDALLHNLAASMESDLAILLNQRHVENAVWQDYQSAMAPGCECYFEGATSPQLEQWMREGSIQMNTSSSAEPEVTRLVRQGQHYAVIRFPIYDYQGATQQRAVGSVVAWHDVTDAWHEYRQDIRSLELMLLGSYLLTQMLLLMLLDRLRKLMQRSIDRATLEAQQANLKLLSALTDSPVVTYSVTLPSTAADYISPNCKALTGYTDCEITGDAGWWVSHLHPLDRDRMVGNKDLVPGENEVRRRRYRMRHRSGRWYWVEDRCRVVTLDDGRQVMHGGLSDISAQQHAEAALAASERTLRRAQSIGHVGSWEYHFADRLMTFSDEACRILSLDAGKEADYALFISRVHPEDREQVENTWRAAMNGEPYDIEHRILALDGERWVRSIADFQHDDSGVLLATGMLQDITRQKLREQELHRLATRDVLTGLANRRYFMQRMEQEHARTVRFGSACGLMMIDLDYFKLVNDHYGHAAGDEVLKAFAITAQSQLRQIDILGRIGGEEFALLLPGTGIEGAMILAERLRCAIEGIELAAYPELRVTASIGVSVLAPDDSGSDAPLLRADRAVYAAKGAGRNQVQRAEPEGCTT